MPKPFRKLNLDEFLAELRAFARTSPGVIDAVHMHHTFRPDHRTWRGLDSVEAIWRFHTVQNRWTDIGQHVTIDPEGGIWTGRDWKLPPCSSPGHNGSRSSHPFMLETAGNFDLGNDPFAGEQRRVALEVIAQVQRSFGLAPETLLFHNQMGPKTCPGTSISYDEVLEAVRHLHVEAPALRSDPSGSPLAAHVVNLSHGRLSQMGSFRTSEADLDSLFAEHLPRWLSQRPGEPLRLLLWAHGGLNSEAEGIGYAHRMAPWWKANGIYPIFFVWETGLLETVRQVLSRRERLSRDIWDGTLDLVTERLARAAGGPKIWRAMKDNASAASKPESGGAWQFARRLASFCQTREVEVHAAGHSAGSIFHSHFVPAVLSAGLASFRSLHFLAPALRADTFRYLLGPLLGRGIDRLTLYIMTREAERADHCSRVYHKSLLYLVSRALEHQFSVPLLGLAEYLPGEPWPNTRYVLSPSDDCKALSHSDFDNDAATLDAIVRDLTGANLASFRSLGEAA